MKSIPPVTSSTTSQQPHLKAGILLSRPPLLTRLNTPFEEAFFFYQKRLHERLALPFTRYFYFKRDTPRAADFKAKAKLRGGAAAKELGSYTGYGDMAWNDELLVGDKISGRKAMVEALVQDAVVRVDEEGVERKIEGEGDEEGEMKVERPLERITKSDREGDQRALDRKLARTVYLVVRGKDGTWEFPSGGLVGRESLHQVRDNNSSLFFFHSADAVSKESLSRNGVETGRSC